MRQSDVTCHHLTAAGAAEAASERARNLRSELRHVHDQLDALEKGSRSKSGTPDPAAPPSGALMFLAAHQEWCP